MTRNRYSQTYDALAGPISFSERRHHETNYYADYFRPVLRLLTFVLSALQRQAAGSESIFGAAAPQDLLKRKPGRRLRLLFQRNYRLGTSRGRGKDQLRWRWQCFWKL